MQIVAIWKHPCCFVNHYGEAIITIWSLHNVCETGPKLQKPFKPHDLSIMATVKPSCDFRGTSFTTNHRPYLS